MKNKKKIIIIGGGIFGCVSLITLKSKFECIILEQSKSILSGASTNNLNRIHLGYHYPRDDKTAQQSYKGVKSFTKIFNKSILKKFENYYFIAKKSKTNFKKYLLFLKKNNLKYKIINQKDFEIKTKNIEGIIKVTEPVYDWQRIKRQIKKRISGKVHCNQKVLRIIKEENNYKIITNKKIYFSDIIIDASYYSSNQFYNISKYKKLKYQLTCVYEIVIKNFDRLGIAIMDGNFFSFLPKGFKKRHIFYDVNYSVLKSKTSKNYKENWLNDKNLKNKAIKNIDKVKKKLLDYLPNIKIKFTKKIHLSLRVIPANSSKTDRRVSEITQIQKNYFRIFSAKIDHSVDIAEEIKKKLAKQK